MHSPYTDPLKKPKILFAFEVKPSIELNDRLTLEKNVGDGDRIFFRDLYNSGEWLSNLVFFSIFFKKPNKQLMKLASYHLIFFSPYMVNTTWMSFAIG